MLAAHGHGAVEVGGGSHLDCSDGTWEGCKRSGKVTAAVVRVDFVEAVR